DHFIQRTYTKYLLGSPTEVVRSVRDCAQFFLGGTPPEIPGVLKGGDIVIEARYKPICQTYRDCRRFMTLYDTVNKIPVFSAYRYKGHTGGTLTRTPTWMGEPQYVTKIVAVVDNDKYASNEDYRIEKKNGKYDRGHLFPNAHASDEIHQVSTYTLTNVVPQEKTFNSQSWGKMEEQVKALMDELCSSNVAGAGASQSSAKTLNNRVDIPQTLWTAFCCFNRFKKIWFAYAHFGDNAGNNNNPELLPKTLTELKDKYGIEPFPNADCLGAKHLVGEIPKGDCRVPKLDTQA
uniref:Endonuclease domain-containing 1 protein n=1 Tax=Gadus morhua TaxID=8049 RepID=A0A8C5AJS7_GADMO